MKKVVIKTIAITLIVAIVLLVAVFGIMSLCAPAVMMRFTDQLGLVGLSGDYAYQEYERSGDVEYLARSFLISAEGESYRTADKRFTVLYVTEGEEMRNLCERLDAAVELPDTMKGYTTRSYLCGLAAAVKYHLIPALYQKEDVVEFAFDETDAAFPRGNPVIALASEASGEEDAAFCGFLLSELKSTEKFDTSNEDYLNIVKILEDAVNE